MKQKKRLLLNEGMYKLMSKNVESVPCGLPHCGHIINIRLPFWLNWTKRFIKITHEKIFTPSIIQGQKADFVILDDE